MNGFNPLFAVMVVLPVLWGFLEGSPKEQQIMLVAGIFGAIIGAFIGLRRREIGCVFAGFFWGAFLALVASLLKQPFAKP